MKKLKFFLLKLIVTWFCFVIFYSLFIGLFLNLFSFAAIFDINQIGGSLFFLSLMCLAVFLIIFHILFWGKYIEIPLNNIRVVKSFSLFCSYVAGVLISFLLIWFLKINPSELIFYSKIRNALVWFHTDLPSTINSEVRVTLFLSIIIIWIYNLCNLLYVFFEFISKKRALILMFFCVFCLYCFIGFEGFINGLLIFTLASFIVLINLYLIKLKKKPIGCFKGV